jgi:hypothetical protein
MECNVGCCTDHLCNGAEGGFSVTSSLWMVSAILAPIALYQLH